MKIYLVVISFLVLTVFNAFSATKTWYDSANIRIESLRKGDFILKIVDTTGAAVADSVDIKLIQHAFPFGMSTTFQSNKTNDLWNKATMLRYFNACVPGNEFKWSGVEANKGVYTYAKFDSLLNWIERAGMQTRGHTLLWNGRAANYHEVPQWVQEAPSVQAMNQYCKDRIFRDVTRYKGRLKEYDVFNEPTRTDFLRSKIGDSIFWNSFKWAHEADPEAQLYVNEYNLIEWDQSADLIALIKKAKNEYNAPIHGIGLQSHFDGVIDAVIIKSRLDKLATLGLQMRVTEFDMKVTEKNVSEKLQALYYARMLRLSFSYPLMTGFYFWGLHDGEVWREGSGLYHEDRTPKIVADSIYNLIHKEWSTQLQAKPANGELAFRGFYGKYRVNALIKGVWKQFEVNCDTSMKGKTIVLEEKNSFVPRPQFVKATLTGTNTVELSFDKKMTDPSKEINNFVVIGKLFNAIVSASLKNNDSTTIVLQLKDAFNFRTYAIISYLSGKYKAADNGELAVFGAQPIKNNLVTYLNSATNTEGTKILVNFNQPMKDPAAETANFKIQVNGADAVINNISLQTGNDSVLVIDLKNPVIATDVIKISYTPGSLSSQENINAPAIPVVSVTNKVLSTGISQVNGKASLYPNPVQDYLTIENEGNLSQLKILSIEGRELLSISLINGKNLVDMQKFVKGQYMVRVTDNLGNVSIFSSIIKK